MARSLYLFVTFCVSLVQFQVRAEWTCSSLNSSVIGVAFDSIQNQTGGWQHSIVISKRGLQKGNAIENNDISWNVEVGYQPIHCDADLKDSINVKITFDLPRSLGRIRNPEYKFYPGLGYYKYHATLDTWPVAKANCEKEGAHLAIINSQQEADALKKLIVTDTWAHIGLVKNDANGEFVTVFGDPVSKTGYSKWQQGVNPASASATYVAVLHKSEGTLSYGAQSTQRSSICEQDL